MKHWLLATSLFTACLSTAPAEGSEPDPPAAVASKVLTGSGVQGGLIVHVGCGDGKLTAALHADESYLVHGLDTDADEVAEARRYIRSRGLYGPVSVDTFDGRTLPYVDNFVNLVVADDLGQVPIDEVLRVLDSIQLTAEHQVATPVNWQQGEDVIIVPAVSDEVAKEKFPELRDPKFPDFPG